MKDYEIEREVERKYLEIDRFLNLLYIVYIQFGLSSLENYMGARPQKVRKSKKFRDIEIS